MRKFLLGLVCGLVVVGVANMGFALSIPWFKHGGGHGKKKGHQMATVTPAATVTPTAPYNSFPNPPVDDPPVDVPKFYAGGGPTPSSGNGNNNHPASVPEPATLILLGIGLLGLASFGRKNFK